jgi:hypothetical protein
MFPILASPDQLDGRLIDDPSRLLANEAQNRLCTLHYLDVSALPKNNIQYLVLHEPQQHAIVSQIISHWDLILIEVLVEHVYAPLALTDSLVVVS